MPMMLARLGRLGGQRLASTLTPDELVALQRRPSVRELLDGEEPRAQAVPRRPQLKRKGAARPVRLVEELDGPSLAEEQLGGEAAAVERGGGAEWRLASAAQLTSEIVHRMGRSEVSRLNAALLSYHARTAHEPAVLKAKARAAEALSQAIEHVFPNHQLHITGGSATGLGARDSDLDCCLSLPPEVLEHFRGTLPQTKSSQTRETAKAALYAVHKRLKYAERAFGSQFIPGAKTPILRLTYSTSDRRIVDVMEAEADAKETAVMMDLNFMSHETIYNTHLLKGLVRCDRRFPVLVLAVKRWAEAVGILGAQRGGLASYSLVLLVIFHLTYGLQRPVLPNLLQTAPERYGRDVPLEQVIELTRSEDRSLRAAWRSENDANVAGLFLSFLSYYSLVDWGQVGLCLAEGRLAARGTLANDDGQAEVFLQEPYTFRNTAASCRRLRKSLGSGAAGLAAAIADSVDAPPAGLAMIFSPQSRK